MKAVGGFYGTVLLILAAVVWWYAGFAPSHAGEVIAHALAVIVGLVGVGIYIHSGFISWRISR